MTEQPIEVRPYGSEPRHVVLMLHGRDDPHPGKATRDLLAESIPHIEYIEYERCGHEPWLERHAKKPFLDDLKTWLRTLQRPAG